MLRAIDEYFLKQDEPVREYLLAMRDIILHHHPGITEAWKYGMPFIATRVKCFVTSGHIKNISSRILAL